MKTGERAPETLHQLTSKRTGFTPTPSNFAIAATTNKCISCGMFKTLKRRASSALRRPSEDGGATPRLANALDRIPSQPHRYQHPGPATAIGYADPLPDPETAANLRLIDYPRNEIVTVCERCGTVYQLRTHRLIAEYGSRERLADVLAFKAEPCPASEAETCILIPQPETV